jgi:hypothetical protein
MPPRHHGPAGAEGDEMIAAIYAGMASTGSLGTEMGRSARIKSGAGHRAPEARDNPTRRRISGG